ncbi:hypothetical protein HRG_009466 [Hirsutella rhossiliensis]|uniref:Uncharacterized protein n=1 Tax=Hirsutella rhossiliensis TaxID=111463 RepID=A0A9P8MSK6_9HYPO|nr:uncharacterized protein HRG_09466 [Hirsutella rhossiliensis]KAH0959684.1 hypothetical protein HRG_09466 [Hirsutella rhossiliensis]
MEKNADKVRHVFVSHEAKQSIVVRLDRTAQKDIEAMITSFENVLKEKVKAPWLSDWIKPGFSTSSAEDELTATVLMMGLMQHYFEYAALAICGLPSVSLLGTKDDWISLRRKLDDLSKFGEEPAEYARVLTPILDGFVNTWDNKDSPDTKEFWSKIVSGAVEDHICTRVNVISGWITGFYFWNKQGNMIASREQREKRKAATVLGDVNYLTQMAENLPVSYAKVPVKLISEGMDAYLLAGNVGVSRTMAPDGRPVAEPMSGWYLYGPVDRDYKFEGKGSNQEELNAISGLVNQCMRDQGLGDLLTRVGRIQPIS